MFLLLIGFHLRNTCMMEWTQHLSTVMTSAMLKSCFLGFLRQGTVKFWIKYELEYSYIEIRILENITTVWKQWTATTQHVAFLCGTWWNWLVLTPLIITEFSVSHKLLGQLNVGNCYQLIPIPWTIGGACRMGIHRMPPIEDPYINNRVQYDGAVQRCNVWFASCVAHVAWSKGKLQPVMSHSLWYGEWYRTEWQTHHHWYCNIVQACHL
jgi:hypothetical protein